MGKKDRPKTRPALICMKLDRAAIDREIEELGYAEIPTPAGDELEFAGVHEGLVFWIAELPDMDSEDDEDEDGDEDDEDDDEDEDERG